MTNADLTCSEPKCKDVVYARGICLKHYGQARYRGELPAIPERKCGYCGEMYEPKSARSVYCSPLCKNRARSKTDKVMLAEDLAKRTCVICGGSLASRSSRKATTCSDECSVAWQNKRRQLLRRQAWEAGGHRCQFCSEPIPFTRRIGTKFCSTKCKHDDADRRWRERNPGSNRIRQYKLSQEDYDAMLEVQGHACASCFSDDWGGKTGVPHVDHDHATGEVRGLLCSGCNHAIGHAKDDPTRLRQMADYLERGPVNIAALTAVVQ